MQCIKASAGSLTSGLHRQHAKGFYGLRKTGPALRGFSGESSACNPRCIVKYASALELARSQDYTAAREAFQECVQMCPDLVTAWISWAQFEKRVRQGCIGDHLQRCRSVLQRGLTLNPNNAKLCQAWGLLELQRGNVLAAVLLLERCVANDPRCSPVLKWKAVRVAQQTVASRRLRAITMARSTDTNRFA